MKNKTAIKIFESKQIRSAWNEEEEKWYFSVIDVIEALTGTDRPRKYWSDLKKKLKKEGSQLSENIGQLKMQSSDGKFYKTDITDTEHLFRLIQSIPSPKAEPFKLWIAKTARQRIDEWEDRGVKKGLEYAILNDEITKAWSGYTVTQYKKHKDLKKENLRDNMTNLELVLNMLAEATTTEISKEKKPRTFKENKKVANQGGTIAGNTRKAIEEKTGKSVVSKITAKKLLKNENNSLS